MRAFVLVLTGALVAVGCGGKVEPSCPPDKNIATSSVVKNGDTWNVNITSKIDAPIDKVVEAASHPEKGHDLVPESILKSEQVSESGNTKTMDIVARLEILPPGFKVQNIRSEYTYYPEQKKFTTKSIDFKLADITSEYQFVPDGSGTLVKFSQKSKDKAPLIVDSLQKGALCETFTLQVKVVKRALGLETAEKPAG
jgi:polyketide cyclase/dehydrase/lipid transport protein